MPSLVNQMPEPDHSNQDALSFDRATMRPSFTPFTIAWSSTWPGGKIHFMDFVVRPISTLPDVTGAVREENNWRIHEGYPAVDWLTIANLSVVVVQERATGWEFDAWNRRGDEAGLFGPDLFAWGEFHSRPLGVGSEGTWVDGRHRAALIAASGAAHVAVVDPQWLPAWD